MLAVMVPGLDPRRRVLFALLVALALVFVGLALRVAFEGALPVDVAARALVQSTRVEWLETPMQVASFVGSGWTFVPVAVVATLVLCAASVRLALFVAAACAGSVVLEAAVKWVVSRPRPNRGAYGFPSGHVLTTVVLVGALLYVIAALRTPRGWRCCAALAGVIVVGGVAYSRLYLNAHWLTDVVGALTGGVAYLLAIVVAFGRRLEGPASVAEAPLALLERTDGAQEVNLAERGPVNVGEVKLAVRALPEQKA